MTIYRTITPDGKLLYYHVRLQRKQDGVGYFYSQDLEAVKAKIREHWELADSRYQAKSVIAKRGFEITDRILWGRRARKWAREKQAPKVKVGVHVNGCRIVHAPGRCDRYFDCEKFMGCLVEASNRNWHGFNRV